MRTLMPMKKTLWYGVYHVIEASSIPYRVLEYVVPSYGEALRCKDYMMTNSLSAYNEDNVMIEAVDVISHEWKV